MSWAVEIESVVSADRMFQAAILDWHNLALEVAPEVFVSATNEGNVRQFNFTSVMPFSYVKERIDPVDRGTLQCESTITEGGHLGTRLESASVKYSIVKDTSGDGCIIKVVTTTKPLPGVELNDEAEEVIDKAKEAMVKHFKTVETYLLANPDKYLTPTSDLIVEGGGDGHSRGVHMIQANGTVHGNAVQHSGNVIQKVEHSGHYHHHSSHHHSGHTHHHH